MNQPNDHSCDDKMQGRSGPPRLLKVIVGCVFAVGGAYYLWTQHRAHVLQYLPLAIFMLCPLMHFFGHGSHGKKNDSESTDEKGGHHHG